MAAGRRLTERQRAVIERIDRRVPIKVIAQEMGVSETRINQHIRALKDFYSAGSLNELVEIYRSIQSENPKSVANFGVADFGVAVISVADPDRIAARSIPTAGDYFVPLPPPLIGSAAMGSDGGPSHLLCSAQPPRGGATVIARLAAIVMVFMVLLALLLVTHSASQMLVQAANEGALIPGDQIEPRRLAAT